MLRFDAIEICLPEPMPFVGFYQVSQPHLGMNRMWSDHLAKYVVK